MIDINEIKKTFSLDESEIIQRDDHTFIVEKYLWDYEIAHQFQLYCVEKVLENPNLIFLIFTSHPNVLTMGRGLQKIKDSSRELVEFDPSIKNELNLSVIDIKRGGGLTFHHHGQFVFYPILKTTKYDFKVHDLMLEILNITKNALLNSVQLNNLVVNKELLGLWYQDQLKIASIGLAVNRFVTYHGLALNFFENMEMKREISLLYPCGLPGNIYTSVEALVFDKLGLKINQESFKQFKTLFLNSFYEMIDKQRSSSPTLELISAAVKDENLAEIILNTDSSLS